MDSNKLNLKLALKKRKKFFSLSRRQRDRVKGELYQLFLKISCVLQSYGLEFNQIELNESNQNSPSMLQDHNAENYIKKKITIERWRTTTNLSKSELSLIGQRAKDRNNLSDRVYSRFTADMNTISKNKLPTLYRINTFKQKMNKFYTIHRNIFGFFVEPIEKIRFVLSKVFEKLHSNIENDTFNLHLSGDGMAITKTHLNCLCFTFKVLNEKDMSCNGLYMLGLFSVKAENYASISLCLQEIIEKLKEIKSIKIGNKNFNIEWTQGGDLKWLYCMNGTTGANSKHSCPWCTWCSDNMEINKEWPISRTILEAQTQLDSNNTSENRGYLNYPLISFIEFIKSIFDPLHLCLRVTDKLFEKLLSFLESIENASEIDDDLEAEFDYECPILNKNRFFKKLWLFVERDCNITNPLYYNKKDKKIKFRSLNQNERIKILEKFKNEKDLLDIFQEIKNENKLKVLNHVLIKFFDLFTIIKKDYTNEVFNEAGTRAELKNWLKYYIKATDNEKFTPYVHIFVFHSIEFIKIYKNLNLFSNQGLEKLNDVTKTNYFRQTNKQKSTFLKQLLEKANRSEFFHLNGTVDDIFRKINNS